MGTRYQLGVKLGYPVQIRTPDLHAICHLSSCLKGQWRRTFEKMNGNLLQILVSTILPLGSDTLLGHDSQAVENFRGRNDQSQEKSEWVRRPS
ncbi:hypothetical protein CR513_09632, partial [Mucuna pruriens]